jgi:pentose-5-phosphate-3-epimerase
LETIHHAYKSGANYLAAASAIFNEKNISEAIEKLKKKAVSG